MNIVLFWERDLILFIRIILAIVIAFVIGRFFFENMTVVKVGLLALVMLGFAYLFEYTKKRDRGKHDGS
jgi:hypothetical protein